MTKAASLASLIHLTELNLSNCEQVADFSFLAELHELERLNLSGCRLLSDLRPLAALTCLTHLTISDCFRVTRLETLAELSNLCSLELDGRTGITSFAPLDKLTRLQVLRGRGTAMDVPEYLIASGDAPSILAWLRGTVVGVGPSLPEIKLLLLGQGRVGKSHLRRRITNGGFDYHNGLLEPTQGIDCVRGDVVLPKDHPARTYSVGFRIWDFGGQNHLHSAHRFFLGGERCFYLLVLAADRPANGEGPESNRLNYWLRMIAWYGRTPSGERSPVAIIITRNDEPAAAVNRQSLEDALQAAERHDWFGAKVVRIVRGMGWSQSLDSERDNTIWNRHMAAYHETLDAIDDHLTQVPGLDRPVPMACQAAIKYVEAAFGDQERQDRQPYLRSDDLYEIDELRELPAGASAEDQRRGLRDAVLGLLNSLGAVHWQGGMPQVIRRNPWGIRDWVFNPEWVKRPVYDLLWRAVPRDAQAGFLTDRHLREVLPNRQSGNPDGADLYEKTAFTDDDRSRVLELMKACRLIFDSPHEPGFLIPDLLDSARLTDFEVPQKGWRYSADFLPEKVMLRFIAEQYPAIDTRMGHCFRNHVIWRRGEQAIFLESHFSPPGGTRPYILIRPLRAEESVSETVAANVGLLLDEIFVDESLGDVHRELAPDVEGRLDGKFVFRRLPVTARRGEKAEPEFSIVFDGVDLGFEWRHRNGLEYLHMMICHAGEPCHVQMLSNATAGDNRNAYRAKQDAVERQEPVGEPNVAGRLAQHHPRMLKELQKALEAKLVATNDEEERQTLANQIKSIIDETERRNSPAMTKLMRTTQQSLKRSIGE